MLDQHINQQSSEPECTKDAPQGKTYNTKIIAKVELGLDNTISEDTEGGYLTMAALFVPKDKQGILLRGPFTYGFAPPSYTSKTKSTFCVSHLSLLYIASDGEWWYILAILIFSPQEFAIERCAGNEEIDGQVPKLFGRNHPHPGIYIFTAGDALRNLM